MNRPPKPDSMQKKLEDSFDRIEKALTAFLDSLMKNNPSEKLAADLVEADRELHNAVKELETHQNNVAKVKRLKEETDALDQKTKAILQNLWDMRKELKSIPTTSYSDAQPKYRFTTAELLSYARLISPHTLPPAAVLHSLDIASSAANAPSPSPNPNSNNPTAQTPNAMTSSVVGTPSASIPAPTTSGAPAPPTPSNVNSTSQQPQQQQTQPPPAIHQPPSIIPPLPPHITPHLNPHEYQHFVPWPTMAQIRSGALMKVQDLINRGIDPKIYDPEEEERKKKEEEQTRKEAEEQARREREEQERRVREERERMMKEHAEAARQAEAAAAEGAAPSSTGSAMKPPPPKQFQFLDDDDDDDDE
ncbi:vitamin-D-receptor interacting mediator subunit 4-domain-containing protein [Podospora fimiseda]|uniref:Mediator of RNA polymerase II transcription subunit 4 n=1 Tax=Podospora fimiseda TaxID=252190 RepID=A0AAN7H3E1_9PEZI|nr:vitamin-D-receptor interacting mediator subunit 4-domain-containing protein [Podospora fimiseda]